MSLFSWPLAQSVNIDLVLMKYSEEFTLPFDEYRIQRSQMIQPNSCIVVTNRLLRRIKMAGWAQNICLICHLRGIKYDSKVSPSQRSYFTMTLRKCHSLEKLNLELEIQPMLPLAKQIDHNFQPCLMNKAKSQCLTSSSCLKKLLNKRKPLAWVQSCDNILVKNVYVCLSVRHLRIKMRPSK